MVSLRPGSRLYQHQHAQVSVEGQATSLRQKHVLQQGEATQQQRPGVLYLWQARERTLQCHCPRTRMLERRVITTGCV